MKGPAKGRRAAELVPHLGERIAATAERVGGKRALAEKAGIGESQLYRYINEENVPALSIVVAIAKVGGVSLHWLATGDEAVSSGAGPGPAPSEEEYKEGYDLVYTRAVYNAIYALCKELFPKTSPDSLAETTVDLTRYMHRALVEFQSGEAEAETDFENVVSFAAMKLRR